MDKIELKHPTLVDAIMAIISKVNEIVDKLNELEAKNATYRSK